MVNDTISDILTLIRNANLVKSKTVSIPLTRISRKIVEILEKQGFIESFKVFQRRKTLQQFGQTSSSQISSVAKLTEFGRNSTKLNTAGLSSASAKPSNSQKNEKLKIPYFSDTITIYLKYYGREKQPCITNLKRISKPGLRLYANHKQIPKVLGGMGIVILSTSKGIMTDREARLYGIGGEILFSIW